MTDEPLLRAHGVSKAFDRLLACQDVSLELWPGEVLGIVGESGSGKTTLLRCLAGELAPTAGTVEFRTLENGFEDVHRMGEARRRFLMRTQWGVVHQNPRDGLRMGVTAGGNVGERLMAGGARHYGHIRAEAVAWLDRVELDRGRIDELPALFSGGMQQRLQIARILVSKPRLVFLDEPTGGLDVSVQAKLLDMLRRLARDLDLAVVIVTHDLGVARLLTDRLMVMRRGRVVEEGLTDQVLDDPHDAYTQLLVASVIGA